MIDKKGRDQFLIITTGHQGEPNSMLVGVVNGDMPFKLNPSDVVVFCSETIPSPVNQANRSVLEKKLRSLNVRIFKDIHVSGHASKEDLREFIKMIKPENYIPTHGGLIKLSTAVQLANELGYELGKSVHLMQNGQELKL
jgi:ribonuclease J